MEESQELRASGFLNILGTRSRAATCVSLSYLGVHLGASIQQATSKSKAELASVRLATNLAFHTKSLLQDLQIAKTFVLSSAYKRASATKAWSLKATRHIELSSQLGQFQLSKIQPQQNLAELLANNLRACDLHRLLPKLQLQARPAGELALPTVQCEGRAFVSSSLGSFYIGQLCCAPAMEKPQLVQKLFGKEFVDHLAIPELESTKLLQQQLSSGERTQLCTMSFDKPAYSKMSLRQLIRRVAYRIRAYKRKSFPQLTLTALPKELGRTALAMELERPASTMSFQQLSLQQHSLQAAYSIGSFQTHSLTVTSLSLQDQLLTPYQLAMISLSLNGSKGDRDLHPACPEQASNHLGHLDDCSFP